tara:strand:+ start:68 stop:640 length:573 start_codon:yes stop_codon:yes gene_type:complete
MNKYSIGVFISGRGSNLKSIIKASKKKNYPGEIKLIFSDNPGAKGLDLAKENNIECFSLDYNKYENQNIFENEILALIEPFKLELICLAGYMRILSKNFIDSYPDKILNIHPSLLPKYKGLNTHRRAIENKENVSGCTVHYVNQNLDDGKIILQREVRIDIGETEKTLADKVLKAEHSIYPEAIKIALMK